MTSDVEPSKVDNPFGNKFLGKDIGGWKTIAVLGSGANGCCLMVQKDGVKGACKIPFRNNEETKFEGYIFDRLADAKNLECRFSHIVRLLDKGEVDDPENAGEKKFFIVMELAGSNPVAYMTELEQRNEDPVGYLSRVVCQVIRALYDLHESGFIYRDLKIENLGMPDLKYGIRFFDMGMCRRILNKDGTYRLPRSYCPFRGTDEWSSHRPEMLIDQGRVDDLWGLLWVYNEMCNSASDVPQAWSNWSIPDSPLNNISQLRMLMKSEYGAAHVSLENCPLAAFRYRFYLLTLGTTDMPDYFFITMLFNETRRYIRKKNKSAAFKMNDFMEEINLMEHYHF